MLSAVRAARALHLGSSATSCALAIPLALVGLSGCERPLGAPASAASPGLHTPSMLGPATAAAAPPTVPTPAVSAAKSPEPPRAKRKVAVLPLDDNDLFRAEREALRLELAGALARSTATHEILPLAEVDAKLAPLSSAGRRCAFAGVPKARRAKDQGWLATDLVHLHGAPGAGSELLVQLDGWAPDLAFGAPWPKKGARLDRYRAAFGALRAKPGGHADLLFGGFAGNANGTNELVVGGLRVCEQKDFLACHEGSRGFSDAGKALEACFAGDDEARAELLVEADGPTPRCELARSQAASPRESCLCSALLGSAAAKARPGRRQVRLRYEAPELAGKPRPEVRVVDTSTNLHAERTVRSKEIGAGKERRWESVQQLEVDNLAALGPALARCKATPGAVATLELEVAEDGHVGAGKPFGAVADKSLVRCVEQQLRRAAFTCTDDGKSAKLRLLVEWPAMP